MNYLLLDLEWSLQNRRLREYDILQLAYIRLNSLLENTEEQVFLYKPRKPVTDRIWNLTGLTAEMLADKEPCIITNQIDVANKEIWVSYGTSDIDAILGNLGYGNNLTVEELADKRFIDLSEILHDYLRLANLRDKPLREFVEDLGLPTYKAHDGLSDCHCELELLRLLVSKGVDLTPYIRTLYGYLVPKTNPPRDSINFFLCDICKKPAHASDRVSKWWRNQSVFIKYCKSCKCYYEITYHQRYTVHGEKLFSTTIVPLEESKYLKRLSSLKHREGVGRR